MRMRFSLYNFYLLPVIFGWIAVGVCAAAYMSYIKKNEADPRVARLIPIFACIFAALFVAWGIIRNL